MFYGFCQFKPLKLAEFHNLQPWLFQTPAKAVAQRVITNPTKLASLAAHPPAMHFSTAAVVVRRVITDLEKVVSHLLLSLVTRFSITVDTVQVATMRQVIAAYPIDLTHQLKNRNLR